MKIQLNCIVLALCLSFLNCNTNKKEISNQELNVSNDSINITENLKITEQKIEHDKVIQETPEYYYISAASGLNYRDVPNGKILGKYHINTSVKAISHSGIFEEIKDGGNIKKGEWLGIENHKDTVYVFDAFLSKSYTYSDIRIYYAGIYSDQNHKTQGVFINLSESYNDYDNVESPLIPEDHIGNDIITFNRKQKSQFLKNANISENDNVYIYDFKEDSIITYPIKSLKLVAAVNGYAKGNHDISSYDYEIGLAISNTYQIRGMNFVYIGPQNIFQKGQLKPMVWDKIDNEDFPIKYDSINPPTQTTWWIRGMDIDDAYTFSSEGLEYYIQNFTNKNQLNYRYLVVRDSKTKKIVFDDLFHDSEGSSLLPLYIKNQPQEDQYQYTGVLFKDKPPILFGFLSHSFGCSLIKFSSYTETPIRLLCDNRH